MAGHTPWDQRIEQLNTKIQEKEPRDLATKNAKQFAKSLWCEQLQLPIWNQTQVVQELTHSQLLHSKHKLESALGLKNTPIR